MKRIGGREAGNLKLILRVYEIYVSQSLRSFAKFSFASISDFPNAYDVLFTHSNIILQFISN